MDDDQAPLTPRRRRRRRAAAPSGEAAVIATPAGAAASVEAVESFEPVEALEPPAAFEPSTPDAAVTQVVPVVPDAPVAPVRRDADVEDALADRRRILWRDSATILIGVILAILTYQTFVPPGTGDPTGSETPLPSGIAIGSLPPPNSLPPGVTFGPIIDPSLGIDATPTPIPVITLGPTPSPSPEPTPTRKPSPKPSKTPAASVDPSVAPTAGGTPQVTAPPPPPPTAVVTCEVSAPMTVTCNSNASTNFTALSEDWHMGGDGERADGTGDGFPTITWTYFVAGTHTVTLTVTGTDGTTKDTDTAEVTVVGP